MAGVERLCIWILMSAALAACGLPGDESSPVAAEVAPCTDTGGASPYAGTDEELSVAVRMTVRYAWSRWL